MKVDYNELMQLNQEFDTLYSYLKNSHNNLLKIINEAECLDDEKIDIFHSYIKEYEAKLATLKSDFYSLVSENKKIESCLSQTRLLKKKRMTKLESRISKNSDDVSDFFDSPF
jgi:uncharacterized coiled-coil DUF342 family protein